MSQDSREHPHIDLMRRVKSLNEQILDFYRHYCKFCCQYFPRGHGSREIQMKRAHSLKRIIEQKSYPHFLIVVLHFNELKVTKTFLKSRSKSAKMATF
jgi:hypothetical protein